jgi:hypothetical protein
LYYIFTDGLHRKSVPKVHLAMLVVLLRPARLRTD